MQRCTYCDHFSSADATSCERCGAPLASAPANAEAPAVESTGDALRDEVLRLTRAGHKIDAIKHFREVTGASLADAKRIVEDMIHTGTMDTSPRQPLDTEIVELARIHGKIAAIKRYREVTGQGLAEAKTSVEALMQRHGVPTPKTGCGAAVVMFAVAAAIAASRLL